MKKNSILSLLVLFLVVVSAPAQENGISKQQNIFDALKKTDSLTNATVKINQDSRIEQLIVNRGNSNSVSGYQSQTTVSGYRVQVFSSNTQRTAKNDAFKIEKQIREQYPNEGVYVNYSSPFWKVRIGDFKSMAQAQLFRNQLVEDFPNLRSETYVVREQVYISGSK